MYRILIVDDEPIIVDGLYNLFLYYIEPELEVHKAYSASQALSLLNELRIDIVLSDIKMPGMNGLEMLREIQTRWPFCHVIFLSGYSEFEYIQSAMELGADSYVLKSQGDEAVLAAVQKSLSLLDREYTDSTWSIKLKEEFKNARPILRKDFLWKVLNGEINDSLILEQQFLKLELLFDIQTPLFLVGGRIDSLLPQAVGSADTRLLEKINAAFNTYTSSAVNSESVYWNRRYILWLVQPLSRELQNPLKTDVFLSGMMERVQSYCLDRLSAKVSLVVDPSSYKWNEIPAGFEKFRSILAYQLGTQNEMLLGNVEFFGSQPSEQYLNSDAAETILSNLDNAFEYKQKEAFDNSLQQLLNMLLSYTNSGQQIALYHKLCIFFLEHISIGCREKDFLNSFHGYSLFSLPYEEWDEKLAIQFSKLGNWLFDGAETYHSNHFNQMIYTLHKYIAEHISKDLSINALAKQVYLNPVYLSRAYKQTTGENLSEYVLARRMDKAKQLLQQLDKKVSEIGMEVGFDSAAHFSRAFKKYTGVSPQELRDSF